MWLIGRMWTSTTGLYYWERKHKIRVLMSLVTSESIYCIWYIYIYIYSLLYIYLFTFDTYWIFFTCEIGLNMLEMVTERTTKLKFSKRYVSITVLMLPIVSESFNYRYWPQACFLTFVRWEKDIDRNIKE